MKKKLAMILATVTALGLTACGQGRAEASAANTDAKAKTETVPQTEAVAETEAEAGTDISGTLTLAAAASLEKAYTEELIPMFEEQYPGVKVQGTYDSSGKLQSQIEAGADVDVFFSAALKQMDALKEEGYIAEEASVDLLENRIVLLVPTGKAEGYGSFEDIVNADMVAIGDPESVPAGQYGKEALENLNLWGEVENQLSFGTNVTEVLNWVAEGSADAGIVYATDAASRADKVTVVAEAPEGSVSKVIYPVAALKEAPNKEAADAFMEFLQTADALAVFETAGFTINQ